MPTEGAVNNESNVNRHKSDTSNFIILFVSLLSILLHTSIGLTLVIVYYTHGHTSWAIITFSFIFFPAVIVQVCSIKLHLVKGNMIPLQWIYHSLLLGVLHRYVKCIGHTMKSYISKTNSEQNVINEHVINLKNLYLMESFIGCAPQIVFQLYILVVTHNPLLLTGFLTITSVFSVTWALILHTRINRTLCPSLIFLLTWRICMMTARISAFVLCAFTFGAWIVLFIGSHWLAMTLWITYQKAVMDVKDKKGEFHSAFFGVIYCFCFFSLRNGQIRCKVIIHNFLLMFENLIFLTVFLMQFSADLPKLAIVSFISVVFGNVTGMSSFLIYNTFFHPNKRYNCDPAVGEMLCCTALRLFGSANNFRTLTNKRAIKDNNNGVITNSEQEELQNIPSDSIIIYEENPAANAELHDIPKNPSEKGENIYEQPKLSETEEDSEEAKLSAAMKRRAICSSVDLERFIGKKVGDSDIESSKSSKGVNTYEAPSEILSAHDYENLCAVNITREPWGIRSWRGYSDIETWGHDDSVFNERRLDNMTTSSEYSGKVEDKDYLNVAEDDLLQCEIDTNSDKTSINCLPPLTGSMLDTIFEEREISSNSIPEIDVKMKCNSESTLVATIDKICLYTPMRSRSGSIDSNVRRESENKSIYQSSVKRDIFTVTEGKEAPSPIKEKIKSMGKLNIFKEKYEINRYHITTHSTFSRGPTVENQGNGENCLKEQHQQNKTTCADGRTRKRFSFKEKGTFLVQVLTPSKLEKRKFPISSPKR